MQILFLAFEVISKMESSPFLKSMSLSENKHENVLTFAHIIIFGKFLLKLSLNYITSE